MPSAPPPAARHCAPGVLVQLRLTGADRAPHQAQGLASTRIAPHRQTPGQTLALGLLTQEALDHPILQGMETDHRQAPARGQQGGDLLKTPAQGFQFVVDPDADGLEAARGRVLVALLEGHRLIDQFRQLAGALQRCLLARLHDAPGDASGETFLAVFLEHPGDLVLVGTGQPGGSGLAGLRVHAHVQGAVAHEAEAALRGVQLGRRDAEVQQDPVQPSADSQSVCDLLQHLE